MGRLLPGAHRTLLGLEVTGEQEQAPQRALVRADLAQHHVLFDDSLDATPAEELLEDGLKVKSVQLQELTHKIVGARREPVGLEVRVARVEKAQDRPGIVDDLVAEEIAVVPGAHLFQLVRATGPREEVCHLGLGEAEAGVEFGAEQRIHPQVVETGEQVLLGHPEDACHHRLVQVEVALEPRAQEGSKKLQDLRRISMKVARVDGLVVLVDEDDHLLAVVGVEVAGQIEERPVEQRLFGRTLEYRTEVPALPLAEPLARGQMVVLVEEDLDFLLDRLHGPLEPLELGLLEREVDDRVALKVGPVGLACLPDRQILEQVGEVLVPLLEPRAQHRQVERFAESPGPREQADLDPGAIDELADHVGFVHVLEAELAELAEVVDANGDAVDHGALRLLYPR